MSTKSTNFTFEIKRNWHLLDSKKFTLGRLAAKISFLLQGKNKPTYSPQSDCGDFVVVSDVKSLKVSHQGKLKGKKYFHYSGYPGGIKERSLKDILDKDPTELLRLAVYRMLPKNKLRAVRMNRLKMFLDEKEGAELVSAMKKKAQAELTKVEKEINQD